MNSNSLLIRLKIHFFKKNLKCHSKAEKMQNGFQFGKWRRAQRDEKSAVQVSHERQ